MQEQTTYNYKFVRRLKIMTLVRDPVGMAVGLLSGKRC
jgi:hypothetical protein